MTSSAFDFSALVPGFDFLKKLGQMGSAAPAAAIPQMGQWIAPTLSVEDIDKRIQELKAVQFWLDQNATALKATVQALEVQKMTIATLSGMNVKLHDMAQAFQLKPSAAEPAKAAPAAPPAADMPSPFNFSAAPAPEKAEPAAPPAAQASADAPADAPSHPAIDPLQWWGALTTQFQQIANQAMTEVAKHAAPLKAVLPHTKTKAKVTTPKAPAKKAVSAKTAAKKSAVKKTAAKKAPAQKATAARQR